MSRHTSPLHTTTSTVRYAAVRRVRRSELYENDTPDTPSRRPGRPRATPPPGTAAVRCGPCGPVVRAHDLRTPQVHSWSASSSSAFTFSIQAFIWGVSTSNSGSNESSSSRARARDARSTGGGHTGHELLRLHVPVQIVTQSKSHVVKKDKHEIEWNR